MSPLAWTLSTVLVAYLVVVEPLWGRQEYRRVQTRSPTDERTLLRLYRLTVGVEWAWVAYLGFIVVVTDVSTTRLLTPPPGSTLPEGMDGIATGLIGGLAAGLAVGAIASRRKTAGYRSRIDRDLDAMVPRTQRERRWFVAVALTAGVCEELVLRGFLLFFLADLLPQANWIALVALAAAVFGLAHLYQGAAGVASTFALGLAFGTVYLATGSLLPGMVLHALLDLRLLLDPRASGTPRTIGDVTEQ